MKFSYFGLRSIFCAISLSLVSLSPIALASTGDIIGYYSCRSQELVLELNLKDSTPKESLIEIIQSFTEYPDLIFAPERSFDEDAIAFSVQVRPGCDDPDCVTLAGWREIQWRIKLYEGTRVSCRQLDQADREREVIAPPGAGGVIGSN